MKKGLCPICGINKIKPRKDGGAGYCEKCNSLVCNIKSKLKSFPDDDTIKHIIYWHIQENRILMTVQEMRNLPPADIARHYLYVFPPYMPNGKQTKGE
jgi:hypothetical protein